VVVELASGNTGFEFVFEVFEGLVSEGLGNTGTGKGSEKLLLTVGFGFT
jgi:hypothetical protein